jgi:preprotein translocase subunit SecD
MMIKFARFNLLLLVALTLFSGTGCKSDPIEKKKKKEAKELTLIELHLEVNHDGATDNEEITIDRNNPFTVNVDKIPFLDGADVTEAVVVDEAGGLFSIKVKFNWRGTQLLDGATAAHHNKRIAVFCAFDESRWLAAPVIRKRIGDGIFTFTPDCTHEEAVRIARGLSNVAKKIKDADKW